MLANKICHWTFKDKIVGTLLGFGVCSVHIPVSLSPATESKKIMDETTSRINIDPVNSQEPVNRKNLLWLASYCPEFLISGKNVQVLEEPSEFFAKLKALSKQSVKRITVASLYLGTGPLEQQLVAAIEDGIKNSGNNLKIKILLDYTRGSRGKENSRTLLLPMLKTYPDLVSISLYHTPNLRGFIKWFLPERWNETIGLSHLKVYLFDDTLVLSGANLSDQYFTNRQDRYIVFHDCHELCNYFDDLVHTVSSMSFQLQPNNSVTLDSKWSIHPTEGSYKDFIRKANRCLQNFIDSAREKNSNENHFKKEIEKVQTLDTFVYPLLQMYTLGIKQDEQVMQKFLCCAEPESHIKLASGYFNLTNHYMNIILKSSKALYSLLVASPKVNGFYGASGISGAIPMAYTHIVKGFFSRVLSYAQENRVQLHEYERSDWTFHVKGLWYYKSCEKLPSATFIGSPNFGYRSVYKDLEAQVAIVTEDKNLQEQLQHEQQRLYERTTPIDKSIFERQDRKVSLWVKIVTFFIKDYF